jgi:hypothetical protein
MSKPLGGSSSQGLKMSKPMASKPIRQRLHEENERVLFCIQQTRTRRAGRLERAMKPNYPSSECSRKKRSISLVASGPRGSV